MLLYSRALTHAAFVAIRRSNRSTYPLRAPVKKKATPSQKRPKPTPVTFKLDSDSYANSVTPPFFPRPTVPPNLPLASFNKKRRSMIQPPQALPSYLETSESSQEPLTQPEELLGEFNVTIGIENVSDLSDSEFGSPPRPVARKKRTLVDETLNKKKHVYGKYGSK